MKIVRVGDVRPSQLLYTYGPGSVVDLPHMSVLVTGIDLWAADDQAAPQIVEKRLLSAVKKKMGPQVEALRLPPHLPETPNASDPWARVGAPVIAFPLWIRCPLCNRVAPSDSGLFQRHDDLYRPDRIRFTHSNCAKAKGVAPPAVPVRFMLSCRNGHLDEFPWVGFVHRGGRCDAPTLEMYERAQSLRTDDLMVKCTNCDSPDRSMVEAFGEAAETSLPKCRGRHPHLNLFSDEECKEQARAMLLGASNSWFSVTARVFAIPEGASPLGQLVDELWPKLADIPSRETLEWALKNQPDLTSLAGHDPLEIWKKIEALRSGTESEEAEDDLLGPEWTQFSDPSKAITGRDFKLRAIPAPPGYESVIERVVLVERLREVVALLGFTRIDPPGEPDASGNVPGLGRLSRGNPQWVPCTEVRGEGIFIQFKDDVVAAWETEADDHPRIHALVGSHERWRARRRLDPVQGWPGTRYLALHTFSHVLMRELAIECGYSSASIGERIYSRSGEDPMAGILLYTAAPDSEGTLGGLVSLGRPSELGPLLDQALKSAGLCSADPMCSEHWPSEDEDALHGAACHVCLFAPETACERANRYLDRSALVDTFVVNDLGLMKQ